MSNGAKSPRVTVCIPAYNQGAYVKQAITSVLQQDYQDFEIIVLDNCSTDNTKELVARFSDPRLHYHCNKRNVGAIRNYNLCLSKARGELIKFLHCDDVLKPQALGEFVRVFDSLPQVGLVHCWSEYIDEQGKVQGTSPYPEEDCLWPGLEMAADSLLTYNFIGGPSLVMFRTAMLKEVGYFDHHLFQMADWQYWIRLLAKGQGFTLAKPLVQYRIHQHSGTAYTIRTNRGSYEEYTMLNKAAQLSSLPELLLYQIYGRVHANALVNLLNFIQAEIYGQALEIVLDILDYDRFLPVYEQGLCHRVLERIYRSLRQRQSRDKILQYLKEQRESLAYQAISRHSLPLAINVFDLLQAKRPSKVVICGTGVMGGIYGELLKGSKVQVAGYVEPVSGVVPKPDLPILKNYSPEEVDGIILACDNRLLNFSLRRNLLGQLKETPYWSGIHLGCY